METLDELRRACQKPNYKTVGTWMARTLTREQALYFTWLLIRTPVTANQVTVFSIFVGVLAGLAYGTARSPLLFFAGALLHQFFYLLDHVDGQIARYRKSVSVTGIYLDYMAHYLVNASTVFGLGCGAYAETGHVAYLFLAASAALFVTFWGVFFDCRYKAFMKELAGRQGELVRVRSVREDKDEKTETHSRARRLFSLFYKMGEGHVVMNTLTAAALLHLVWPSASGEGAALAWRQALAIFYGLLYPFVFLGRFALHIRQRRADLEFQATFEFQNAEQGEEHSVAGER